MKIILHKNFKKQYKRLTNSEKIRFKERRDLFLENPFDPILNNHPLSGKKYYGYRSIDIKGDLRVIFWSLNSETALFVAVGTHNKLYK